MRRTISHEGHDGIHGFRLETASKGCEWDWMVTNLVDNHDDDKLYIIYLGSDATERPDAVLFGRSVRSRIYGVL